MNLVVAAITGVDLDGHLYAIEQTRRCIPHETRQHIHYAPGITRDDYSRIVVKELPQMLPDADFVLIVQADGYALHPERWTDEFFTADYCGAPFPSGEVGNGGVSLRSRRFLLWSSVLHEPDIPEDAYLCQKHGAWLRSKGLVFAPQDLAHRFSHEHPVNGEPWDIRDSFAVHGRWNLPESCEKPS